MNYLIPAYVIILSGIVGYQISLFIRKKKLDEFFTQHNKENK